MRPLEDDAEGRLTMASVQRELDAKAFYSRLFETEAAKSDGCDLIGSSAGEIALPPLSIRISMFLDRVLAKSRLAHGWAIRKDALDSAGMEALVKLLTISPPAKGGFGGLAGQTYPLHRWAADELVVPRPFGVLNFGMSRSVDRSGLSMGQNCNPELMRFSKEYRLHEGYPPQKEATQRVVRRWQREGSAILSLPCGMGKTACAIWLSTEGTRQMWGNPAKTLVLVSTEKLLHQWIQSYARFAPTTRVKPIQGKRLDYHDCDVCVAMVQTVMGHLEFDPSPPGPFRKSSDSTAPNPWGFWSEFALVVVDEVHHVAAKRFSEVVTSFNARLFLGLSATPEGRADGNHHAVAWLTGQIAFRMRRDPSKDNLLIHMVHVDVDIPGFPKDSNLDTCWAFSKAQDSVANCWQRNAILARILVRLARQNRMIFALADRRAQICPDEGTSACVTSLVAAIDPEVGKSCALLVGSTPIAQQDAALEKSVVLATFPMAEEALDDPKRDTLVLLTFKTNRRCLEQSIGRIVRLHERKKTIRPMLVDLVDKQETLNGRAHVRARIYREVFGYECEHHQWSDIQDKFPPPPARSYVPQPPATVPAKTRAPPKAKPPKAKAPRKVAKRTRAKEPGNAEPTHVSFPDDSSLIALRD